MNKQNKQNTDSDETHIEQVLPGIDHPDFSKLLRIARASLGLTQNELAEKLGVMRATVSRWEVPGKNKTKMRKSTWINLCRVLRELGFEGSFVYTTDTNIPSQELSIEDCIERLKELGAKEVHVTF